jgi:hypothetical protein
VFGDTFISRILEEGEFIAVISVNGDTELARWALSTAEGHGVANARNELEEKAEVLISVSWTVDGNDEKMRNGMMSLSMRCVKVLLAYGGGGGEYLDTKKWNIENVFQFATGFPGMVTRCPQKIVYTYPFSSFPDCADCGNIYSAVLSKYSTLPSLK